VPISRHPTFPAYWGAPWTIDYNLLRRENVAVQDYDGDEPTGELQTLVNQDMTRILEYGQDHPDDYGGRWLDRGDRTYGVTFTKSVERHEAALRAVLNISERLRVQSCAHSYAELSAVCDRLRNEDWGLSAVDQGGKPAISGFGPSEKEGVVWVRVQSGRADVSQRLLNKYGLLIAVEEGDWTAVLF
jgi:hypothetical protein